MMMCLRADGAFGGGSAGDAMEDNRMKHIPIPTVLMFVVVASVAVDVANSQPVDSELQRLRDRARAASKPAASAKAEPTGVAAMRREAADMELLVQSDL